MSVSSQILDELRKARAAMTEVLRHSQNAAPHVADALCALERLEQLLEAAPTAAKATVRYGRRNQPKIYRVEGRTGQGALCEYRADDPERPFRCPKETYDVLARVMANMPKPAKFDDITRRLKKELGELPALYQLRVALRFWTTPEGGLVERVRAKYKAATPRTLVCDAQRMWAKLQRSTFEA